MYQKGGLEPLIKVPTNKDFKYTLNQDRKLWIRAIYPYIDIFLQSIREIPFQTYSYDGIAYVKNTETDKIELHSCFARETASTIYPLNSENIRFFENHLVMSNLQKNLMKFYQRDKAKRMVRPREISNLNLTEPSRRI